MPKLYYNSSSLATSFNSIYTNLLDSFLSFAHFLTIYFIKFLPIFCLSVASRESIITSDLASFIAPKLNISFDSALKNINRFLSNPNYDFVFFYSKFISYILFLLKLNILIKEFIFLLIIVILKINLLF